MTASCIKKAEAKNWSRTINSVRRLEQASNFDVLSKHFRFGSDCTASSTFGELAHHAFASQNITPTPQIKAHERMLTLFLLNDSPVSCSCSTRNLCSLTQATQCERLRLTKHTFHCLSLRPTQATLSLLSADLSTGIWLEAPPALLPAWSLTVVRCCSVGILSKLGGSCAYEVAALPGDHVCAMFITTETWCRSRLSSI